MAKTKVEITAVDRTAAAFRSAGTGLNRLGRQVLGVKTQILALVGVGGIGLMVKRSFEMEDAAVKLSDRLGIVNEKFGGLRHAMDLAGVSQQNFATAARSLSKNIVDFANGTGRSQDAFNDLNLSASRLLALPLDEQLQTVLDRLAQIENVTLRNAYAQKIFGDEASAMLNLIADGAGGIRKATEDAIAWNAALTRVDAAKLEQANDAMTRAKTAAQGVFNTIAVALAPVITALANRFADSAKEANGFREEVLSGMETAATAIGYVANVVQGLRFAWAGLKLVVGAAINLIIDGVASWDRALTDLANKFSGSWIGKKLGIEASQYNESLQLMAEVSKERLGELKDEFDAIAMEGLPAEKVKAFFATVRAEAQTAAEATAAARARMNGGVGVGSTQTDAEAQAFARFEEQLRNRVLRLSESQMAEREQLALHLEETRLLLDEAFVTGLITEEEQKRLLQEMELQHQAKLGSIVAQGALARRRFMEMNATQQTQFVLGQMLELTNGVAAHNKTMFRINKIAGIANAVINTAQGVTKALSAYPPPLSFAMAALQAAAGLAQINQIKSAQFGSATSAPSVAGGGAVPVQPVPAGVANSDASSARGGTTLQIIIEGNVIGNEDFVDRVLAPRIGELINDRDLVLISPNSRQARELAPA